MSTITRQRATNMLAKPAQAVRPVPANPANIPRCYLCGRLSEREACVECVAAVRREVVSRHLEIAAERHAAEALAMLAESRAVRDSHEDPLTRYTRMLGHDESLWLGNATGNGRRRGAVWSAMVRDGYRVPDIARMCGVDRTTIYCGMRKVSTGKDSSK